MTPDVAARKAKLEAILERLRVNRERLSIAGGKPLVRSEEDAVTSQLYRTDAPAPAQAPPPAAAAPVAAPVAAPPPPPPSPRLKPLPPRPAAAPVARPPGGLTPSLSRPAPAPGQEDVTWEGQDEEEMEVSEVREPTAPVEPADEEPLAATASHSQAAAPPPPPPLPSTTVSPSAVAAPAAMPSRPVRAAGGPGAAAHGEETSPQAMRVQAPAPIEAPVIRTLGTVEAARPRTIGDLLRVALRLFESD